MLILLKSRSQVVIKLKMDIWKATKRDVNQLARLFKQDAEYHQRLARYYELQQDFAWVTYTEEKLKGRNRMVCVAGSHGNLTGFIDTRIINYPPTTRYKSILQRICRPPKKKKLLPLKPMRWGVIEECYVNPSFRKQGIGSKLVYNTMEWFRSKQVSRIEISVVTQNKEGEAFWQKLGFETFRLLLSKEI